MDQDIEYQPTSRLIEEAIQNRYALTVHYMSDEGTVETFRRITPFTFGRQNGQLYIRVQHLSGQSFSSGRINGVQRLFKFSRLLDINQQFGLTYDGPNPAGYNPDDTFFDSIIKTV